MSRMLAVVLVPVWRCWAVADGREAAEEVQERRMLLLLERARPHIVERNMRPV
jgi:hypothetical protein